MTFDAIIEIPKGSNQKFEIDEATGEFKVNFVFKDLVYPFNYGFVPHTLAEDGDPIDVNLLTDAPLKTGDKIKFRPIGIMKMKDRGKQDNKILAVLENDESYQNINDLSENQKQEYIELYQEIARQKNKVTVFEGFGNEKEAIEDIKKATL